MQRESNIQAQRRYWLGNGGSAGKTLIQGLEYELALVVEKGVNVTFMQKIRYISSIWNM